MKTSVVIALLSSPFMAQVVTALNGDDAGLSNAAIEGFAAYAIESGAFDDEDDRRRAESKYTSIRCLPALSECGTEANVKSFVEKFKDLIPGAGEEGATKLFFETALLNYFESNELKEIIEVLPDSGLLKEKLSGLTADLKVVEAFLKTTLTGEEEMTDELHHIRRRDFFARLQAGFSRVISKLTSSIEGLKASVQDGDGASQEVKDSLGRIKQFFGEVKENSQSKAVQWIQQGFMKFLGNGGEDQLVSAFGDQANKVADFTGNFIAGAVETVKDQIEKADIGEKISEMVQDTTTGFLAPVLENVKEEGDGWIEDAGERVKDGIESFGEGLAETVTSSLADVDDVNWIVDAGLDLFGSWFEKGVEKVSDLADDAIDKGVDKLQDKFDDLVDEAGEKTTEVTSDLSEKMVDHLEGKVVEAADSLVENSKDAIDEAAGQLINRFQTITASFIDELGLQVEELGTRRREIVVATEEEYGSEIGAGSMVGVSICAGAAMGANML